GTHLITYLVRKNIDCLLVTGTSTCGCVRGTVLDGYSFGYPVFLVEECVFDRSRTSHLVNLFEMNAKYATVIQLNEALNYVQRLQICFRPKGGKPMLLVYGNDKAKAKALPWVGEVRAYVDVPFPEEMIAGCLKAMGLGEAKLGFELGDDQRLGIPANYLLRLTEALPKAQIKDGTAALTEMRLIKSPQEIEFMRKACDISMKAYDRCLPQLRPGMTRREVADKLYI